MIRTDNLTKRFGDNLAVDHLTLEVHEGEVFGFLGPNGAGKTTTVRMLCGLIGPSEGKAWINNRLLGESEAADNAIRAQIGILTESPGLYEGLSALANLAFYAQLYGVANPHAQAEKYLHLLDLWERRNDQAATFSKGMKQKLVVARALVHEPKLIFLDEPTSGLDPAAARNVRDFIATLKGQGRTIFLTTHNLEEAEHLCDRVAIFRSHLLAVDAPEALRRRMFGRQTVVKLASPLPAGQAVLQSLPFVQHVEAQDHQLSVTLSDPETQNPQLVRALVQAGAEVQYVTEREASLEQVYLSMVS